MHGCLPFPPPFAGFLAMPHRFLWHEPTRTAILSDLHLGAEVSLARQGIYLPDTSSAAIEKAWQAVLALGPARVVLAGDVFDAAVPDERSIALSRRLLGGLGSQAQVTLTPGNHDPDPLALEQLCAGLPVSIDAATVVAGMTIVHGHQSADGRGIGEGRWAGPPEDPRRYWLPRGLIVGHQHPAVVLATRVARAKMICYAVCRVRVDGAGGAEVPVAVLPAFSPLPLGSNLLTGRNWIVDIPAPRASDVQILGIVDRQVLDFGVLEALGG